MRQPDLAYAESIDPFDRPSWKRFGDSGPGCEFLYRLYGEGDRLLYVGITWNPHVRWTRHSKSKAWWSEVHRAELWLCLDEDEARYWESRCIKGQRPLHNIHQAVA